jgi:hypothetical protein
MLMKTATVNQVLLQKSLWNGNEREGILAVQFSNAVPNSTSECRLRTLSGKPEASMLGSLPHLS